MNAELIHKPGWENLLRDALSHREEHMGLRVLVSLCTDAQLAALSDFDKEVLEAYKIDPTMWELNEMFNFHPIERHGLSSKFRHLRKMT